MFSQLQCILPIVEEIIKYHDNLVINLFELYPVHVYLTSFKKLIKAYYSFFQLCRHNSKFGASAHNRIIYFNIILLR